MLKENKTRLLLISCSRRKRIDKALLPAIERYDGPTFRLIRRYFQENHEATVAIRILSARYGLIPLSYDIPYYDLRMTRLQSQRIHEQVIRSLNATLKENSYSNLLLCLGRDYLQAIDGYENFLSQHTVVQLAEGGIGRKLSILHDWLYGEKSKFLRRQNLAPFQNKVKIRGIEINTDCDTILNLARKALCSNERGLDRYQSWCVNVDGQRVSPKWLVSKITGLPVRDFTTDQARRVLAQLGVEVIRI